MTTGWCGWEILVNVAQCYDRVNNTMTALLWVALQAPAKAVTNIVSCLQYMTTFTSIGWRDLTTYFGGPDQNIPSEPASWIQLSSIIVNACKAIGFSAKITDQVTSDQTSKLQYLLSKMAAQSFLTSEQDWSTNQFNEVGWDWLHQVLEAKPVMLRLCLCKKHTNFCPTGLQMRRCRQSEDYSCPSCWSRKEHAWYLCTCPSKGRTSLFLENIADLEHWLTLNNNTYLELAYWLTKYNQGRGKVTFANLVTLSHDLQQVAVGQDKFGWRNMMEGRISKQFSAIQSIHHSCIEQCQQ